MGAAQLPAPRSRRIGSSGGLRRAAVVTAALASAAVAAATAQVLCARGFWIGELAASLRWQLGWLALFAGLAALFGGQRRGCLLLAVLGFFNLAPEGSLFLPRDPGPTAGRTWVLGSVNLRWDNPDEAGFREWLARSAPDVLFAVEVSPAWRRMLESLSETYPEQVFSPAEPSGSDEWGTALLARVPLAATRLIPPRADRYRPLIEAELDLDGWAVLLRGAHPVRPGEPDAWRRRNLVLATLADEAWPAASILVGDLNTTSTSPAFQDLVAATGLDDSRRGFGRQPSFGLPPSFPLLGIAIDHVLTGPEIEVVERETRFVSGSDHVGVLVRFALRAR